ncbi:MAG: response regulator [Rhodospirillales bacterium]|nr:response regulator [Rhodospirillales bacterium]
MLLDSVAIHGRVPAAVFNRLAILIVDGNRHMRTLVRGILRAFGARNIHEANDGDEALKIMAETAIDLLITEYTLEHMDGLHLVHHLRTAADSPRPHVAVILLTGHTEKPVVVAAREVGINEFLAKPISPESLYARLVRMIFEPRPFLAAPHYFGPDRRRFHPNMRPYRGVDRRKMAPPEMKAYPLIPKDELLSLLES